MPAYNVPTAAELEDALRNESWNIDLKTLPSCTVVGPLRRQENSWLFKAELAGHGALALKVCLDPIQHSPCAEIAAQELQTLSRMHRHFARARRLGVPRPYPLLIDRGILVTEWIEGMQLSEMLAGTAVPSRATARAELVTLAGSWLRYFHDFAPAKPGPLVTGAILSALYETLSAASPMLREDTVVHEAVDLLDATAKCIDAQPYARALLHGDFKADNLIVSGDRLLGFDIALQHENVVLRDLAPFLNHLELVAYHPRGFCLAPSIRRLSTEFLRGYFDCGETIPVKAVAWVRVNAALVVWADRGLRQRSRLKGWYSDWCFRRLTRSLCQELRGGAVTPGEHVSSRES